MGVRDPGFRILTYEMSITQRWASCHDMRHSAMSSRSVERRCIVAVAFSQSQVKFSSTTSSVRLDTMRKPEPADSCRGNCSDQTRHWFGHPSCRKVRILYHLLIFRDQAADRSESHMAVKKSLRSVCSDVRIKAGSAKPSRTNRKCLRMGCLH